MLILKAIILGIIQAITEFVPVSSSGHLIIFHDFIGGTALDNISFDVILHLGTVFALLIYFWQDIIIIAKDLFTGKEKLSQKLGWQLIIATIPAVIIGYFFNDIIETVFRSQYIVGVMLILGGILFFIAEKSSKQFIELNKISLRKALLIGCAQVLAFVPGVSRSGITIIAGLGTNLKREVAAKFSFLLGIPIIFGASIKEISEMNMLQNTHEWLAYIMGFIFALTGGYLVIKYFLKFLQSHSLNIFGFYRIVLGIIIIILSLF